MKRYFVITCPEPLDWEDSALLEATPLPPGELSWRIGKRFSTHPVEPIEIQLDPTHSAELVTLYKTDALIIPRSMLSVLQNIGVTNLDAYQTSIIHPNGFETNEYVACNVIGIVSAMDTLKSNVIGGTTYHDLDVNGFTLDHSKVPDLHLFRLIENTSALIVSEQVKDSLLQAGFSMLKFIPPEKWVG